MIFSTPKGEILTVKADEIQLIQKRFMSIINSFKGTGTHYVTQGGDKLPYNSLCHIGELGNQLILHFTSSFHNPLMLIIDTKTQKARNDISIEDAKEILKDYVYEDIKESLEYPRTMDYLFKNVNNIDEFIKKFEEESKKHKNPNTITGMDCFEFDL